MKEKTCCFTGHRNIPQKEYPYIEKRLNDEVLALINQGVVSFVCGGALGFDYAQCREMQSECLSLL